MAANRINKFIKFYITFKKKTNYLVFTHNVILRCLVGKILNIKENQWFKININYYDLLEFKLEKKKLVSNIKRDKFLSIFKNFY